MIECITFFRTNNTPEKTNLNEVISKVIQNKDKVQNHSTAKAVFGCCLRKQQPKMLPKQGEDYTFDDF